MARTVADEVQALHEVMGRMAEQMVLTREAQAEMRGAVEGLAARLETRLDELARRIEEAHAASRAAHRRLDEAQAALEAMRREQAVHRARLGGGVAVLREWLPWAVALVGAAAGLAGWLRR